MYFTIHILYFSFEIEFAEGCERKDLKTNVICPCIKSQVIDLQLLVTSKTSA